MNKKNLANAQLLNSITTGATTITVKQGQGEALPSVPFFATLTPLGVLSTIDNSEIVEVTARTGDVLTVVRAQRGTSAKTFAADSILANSIYIEDLDSGSSIVISETPPPDAQPGDLWGDTSDTQAADLAKMVGDILMPVGHIYINKSDSRNPSVILGFGTWIPYAEGRTIVGKAPTGTFSVAGDTMGSETHTLTIAEMPSHNHGVSQTGTFGTSGNSEYYLSNNQNLSGGKRTGPTGGGEAHNNIQPSIVAYMWERTL